MYCFLASVIPFGLSVLFLLMGLKSSEKANEGNSEQAEKTKDVNATLVSLLNKGLISEEEYQQKLKMLKSGVQKSMDDLKSFETGWNYY